MEKKICVYSPPFPRMKSYRDVIDFALEYNIKAIEPFCMFEFAQPDVDNARKIKEYANEKGIYFSCFSVYTTIENKDINEQVSRLKKYADVASVLGSPYLHHTIVGESINPDKVLPRKNELFSSGISVVRDVFDYAQSIGVRSVYENQGYIFNGVKGFGEFLEKVDRNVGVVADFGNISQMGESIESFIEAFSDKIVHTHIKDVKVTDEDGTGSKTLDGKFVQSVQVGKGCIDCTKVIELLKKTGYDGYYSIEYAVTDDNSPQIDEVINLVKSWL